MATAAPCESTCHAAVAHHCELNERRTTSSFLIRVRKFIKTIKALKNSFTLTERKYPPESGIFAIFMKS
jgi:hypothetical protein